MRLGPRKLLALTGAGTVALVAVVLAIVEALAWLLLLIVVLQILVLGVGAVAARSVNRGQLPRQLDRRLGRLETEVTEVLKRDNAATDQALARVLADAAFLEQLRTLALPQLQAEQVLRTIEAGNARLETGIDQLMQRLDGTHGSSTTDEP